jgi:radical SAM superfamily enzyme YgiQ (UPF0313 family)
MPTASRRRVQLLLLDVNPCVPPVYPLGLEVVAQAARSAGYEVAIVSASPHAGDYAERVGELESYDPQCIGLQIRNCDLGIMGLAWPKLHDFYQLVVAHLRGVFPGVPLVFGGAGFSVAPHFWLTRYEPDYGIVGAGEHAIVHLLEALLHGKLPELLVAEPDGVGDLTATPRSARTLARWIDQSRSVAGSIPWANIEVQRGCPRKCRFCVEPAIHGRRVISKPVPEVMLELETLVNAGVSEVFFCASEFNTDQEYSLALCRALESSGLSGRMRWVTYVCPFQLDHSLVMAMQRAGCRGVSVNAVHPSDLMLRALGCPHRERDLELALAALRNSDIDVRLTYLVGALPESTTTLESLFDFVRRHPYESTISAGLACYPGLELGDGQRKFAGVGAPVPYAINLTVEQLTVLEQFVLETPHAHLANEHIGNIVELLQSGKTGPN